MDGWTDFSGSDGWLFSSKNVKLELVELVGEASIGYQCCFLLDGLLSHQNASIALSSVKINNIGLSFLSRHHFSEVSSFS